VDKLNKLNEKIRTMIRRFNEQLNDIINKNAVIIRMKENSNQLEKTIEEKLKVLEEEKKNNAKMLERMELEIDRMRYR
jgi:rRNA maturation protein Rpf1